MKILAHRGFWRDEKERNTLDAIKRAFDSGFGIETDLRDACGRIVISHDCPRGDEISFDDVLDTLGGRELILALNIKADGMSEMIRKSLADHALDDYFTFDMSVPEMMVQKSAGLRYFSNLSDIAPCPVLKDGAAGIWLDSFGALWYGREQLEETVLALLDEGKSICVVSEELHHRDPAHQWQLLKGLAAHRDERLLLCTDRPEEARRYFNV